MRFKKWNIGTPAERDVALLRSAGYPYLLSTVLAARGVTTAEAAAEALERDRSLSMSPMLMRDMDKAVDRIQQALNQGETIAVFGDYDVDGITSTVLLMDYLKSCGVRCLRHIPRRIEEGYGLSKEAIQGLRDQGATLMITVDCGITGNEEIDKKFCSEAAKAGFVSIKGHRSVGGMRASIYNAMPVEGVEKLVRFMEEFEKNEKH